VEAFVPALGWAVLICFALCATTLLAWLLCVVVRFVGVYVVYVPGAGVCRFVLGVASGVLERLRVRRDLRRALVSVPFDVTGQLSYDASGPFLEVQTVSGPMRVRVNASDLVPLVLFNGQKPALVKESHIATSSTVRSPLPSFQVIFRVDGRIVGYGSRLSFGKGGLAGVLTARHVLSGLPEGATIGTEKYEYPLDRKWKVLAASSKLDFVLLDVPAPVLSELSVSQAKASRLPRRGAPIRIYGKYNGEPAYTLGTVQRSKNLRFAHSASTHAGFSGAPVVSGGRVIGLHVSGFGSYNGGIALDWAFKSNLESDVDEQAFREQEVSEPDEEFDIWQNGRVKRMRLRGPAYDWDDSYDQTFEDRVHAAGQLTWAELAELDDDDWGFDDYGRRESDHPEPLKARGLVGEPVQPTVETTSGQSSAAPLKNQVLGKASVTGSSLLSGSPESSPGLASRSTVQFPPPFCSPSPPLESGAGQSRVRGPLSGVSSSMPEEEKKVSSRRRKSGRKSSTESQGSTQKSAFPSGRVPVEVRAELRALGIKFRKSRRTLSAQELDSLERAGNSIVLEAARKHVSHVSAVR
jgi:hypothetical protein